MNGYSTNDLNIAKDVGALQADVRVLKHDVAGVSTKIDGLSNQISQITNQQSRGLGFFAGAVCIITTFGGILLVAAKALFGGLIVPGSHP